MAVVVVLHGQDNLVLVPSVSTSLGHMNGSRICRTHMIDHIADIGNYHMTCNLSLHSSTMMASF